MKQRMKKFTFSFDRVLSGILKRDVKKITAPFFLLNRNTLTEKMQTFTQRRKKSFIPGLLIFIEFQKAFDSV